MTPNIKQNVIPRRTHKSKLDFGRNILFSRSRKNSTERGSISNAAVTTGFGIIALILITVLGFFYLQQVLGTASQGTDIAAFENELVELKQKQRQLELEGARIRSLQTVEKRIQKLNLVTTNQVSYLADSSDQVAVLPKSRLNNPLP